ncbi:MAG TPA: hypothetical protein VFC07_01195 [Verrucomicrobiae bacterium]|nr:hypothetical protein [Verrucomicrobiae bacterium]
MSARGNAFSRNPNMCASCSSLSDGMDDAAPPVDAPPPAKEKSKLERVAPLPKPADRGGHAIDLKAG